MSLICDFSTGWSVTALYEEKMVDGFMFGGGEEVYAIDRSSQEMKRAKSCCPASACNEQSYRDALPILCSAMWDVYNFSSSGGN
jgi:hypothetical protein